MTLNKIGLLTTLGAGVAVAAMKAFEGEAGARRLEMLKEKYGPTAARLRDEANAMFLDAKAMAARVPDDALLSARVRAKLKRSLRDEAEKIGIMTTDGKVTLFGPAGEKMDSLLETIARMRGVSSIENHLEPADGAI